MLTVGFCAFWAVPASASLVDVVNRTPDGRMDSIKAELTTPGSLPSSLLRSSSNGAIQVSLGSAFSMGEGVEHHDYGSLFARLDSVSPQAGLRRRNIEIASLPQGPRNMPVQWSSFAIVPESPLSMGGLMYGGISSQPQPKSVLVGTITGTVGPPLRTSLITGSQMPIPNPLPATAWLFGTALGLGGLLKTLGRRGRL